MSAAVSPVPRWKVALRLGRVSNLPTVWTNVAAGVLLAGASPHPAVIGLLALSMSLFYTGGMFLNDAFDREIDARERPERPIPAGLVTAGQVLAAGFGMLLVGELILVVNGLYTGAGQEAAVSGAALGGAIVLYDRWHKQNPLSPVVMGLCRALVYATAALAVRPDAPLWPGALGDVAGPRAAFVGVGALVSWCHLIGLTYAAKQERLDRIGRMWPLAFLAAPLVFGLPALGGDWPGIVAYVLLLSAVVHAVRLLRGRDKDRFPRAVMALIAAISLLDALLAARAGAGAAAVLATAAGFPATLWLQRWVRGT